MGGEAAHRHVDEALVRGGVDRPAAGARGDAQLGRGAWRVAQRYAVRHEACGAPPERHDGRDRLGDEPGRRHRREGAEVEAAVVAGGPYHGKTGERLVERELEVGVGAPALGDAVVAGSMLVDEADFGDRRLQRGGTADVADALRLAQHRPDLAAVVAGEVGAHPLAQVRGLADVQHLAPAVDEQVHAGRPRERRGEPELGHLRMGAEAGSASRSSSPSTPNAVDRSSSTCSRSVVASASSRARWLGLWSRRNRVASVPRRQFGTSSRTNRRASAHVSTVGLASRGRPMRSNAALRKETSKRMLWPTMTAAPMKSTNVPSTLSMRGAGNTMACVMPVSIVISGGISAPGFTSVWKVPRTSPPRTRTAPISVIPHACADPPVVSRSSTQNVVSTSGVPRSSNERCTAARYGERLFVARTRVRCKVGVGAPRDRAIDATAPVPCAHGGPVPLHLVRQSHQVRRRVHPSHARVPPLHRRAAS